MYTSWKAEVKTIGDYRALVLDRLCKLADVYQERRNDQARKAVQTAIRAIHEINYNTNGAMED